MVHTRYLTIYDNTKVKVSNGRSNSTSFSNLYSQSGLNKNNRTTIFKLNASPVKPDMYTYYCSDDSTKAFHPFENETKINFSKSTNNLNNHKYNNSVEIPIQNGSESPLLQLDLQINTPKSDIRISRKCKSYQVSEFRSYKLKVN